MDGYMDAAKSVHTGYPQGSLVSGVLANYYYTPLLELATDKVARHSLDTFAQEPEAARMSHQTPITAGLFVDDESLYTASNSPTSMQSDYRRQSRKS